MLIILYGLLLAHIASYSSYYANIGTTFAITYAMKRLIRSGGMKDHSDLIGLGGYTLTVGELVKLIAALKKSGTGIHGLGISKEQSTEIVGGLLGKGFDSIKDLLTK